MHNNDNTTLTTSPLSIARNRWREALRMLMLGLEPTVYQIPVDHEAIFTAGGPLDLVSLQYVAVFMKVQEQLDGEEPELVYLEFDDETCATEPRAIHVIAMRDGIFHLRRNCTLWLDRAGKTAALMSPHVKGGQFVMEGDTLVNRPGQPAKSLAPGYARARTRLRDLAAGMPDSVAWRCYEPFAQAA